MAKGAISANARAAGPPPARLAFRVGIIGHRPNRLPSDTAELARLEARIDTALAAVGDAVHAFDRHADRTAYDPAPARLVAITPLAEGSDRMFGRAALRHGFDILCPMPFRRARYVEDFIGDNALEPNSLETFDGLLAEAEAKHRLTVFEIDSARDDDLAYAAAGAVVLNQSDLLIVVWDGGKSAGHGGTTESIELARAANLPVLCIDAMPPFACRWLGDPGHQPVVTGEDCNWGIAEVVQSELRLPHGPGVKADSEANKLQAYLGERPGPRHWWFAWKWFRNIVGDGRWRRPSIRLGAPADSVGWPRDVGSLAMQETEERLQAHFGWSDRLADLYADRHRSVFVLGSLGAAGAVLLALLPDALVGLFPFLEEHEAVSIGIGLAELALVLWVVLLLKRAHHRGWHDRWIEYRMLAELVRQFRLSVPLGGNRPLPRSAPHLASYGEPTRSWMFWQFRAIAREAGLPPAIADADYIRTQLASLRGMILDSNCGQQSFHQVTAARCDRIRHRLQDAAEYAAFATLGIIAAHIILGVLAIGMPLSPAPLKEMHERGGPLLILLAAFLPALSAALANINNQGEFTRLAKRSQAMTAVLAGFLTLIDQAEAKLAASPHGFGLRETAALSDQIGGAMLNEVVDWRVVVADPPQPLN